MHKHLGTRWLAALAAVAWTGCSGGGGGPSASDASLSALRPSAGALNPAFTPSNTSYLLVVPGTTDSLRLVPTATDPNVSSISVSQDGVFRSLVLSNGVTPPLPVPVEGLTSLISVSVTARDGQTQREYRITLKREAVLCGTADPPAQTPDQNLIDHNVTEPQEPDLCTACNSTESTLHASFAVDGATGLPMVTSGKDPNITASMDTAAIQQSLNDCAPAAGQRCSIHLALGTSGKVAFVSGPLTLKSGEVLVVEEGVTLFASRDPSSYDPTQTVRTCGVLNPSSPAACNPLISATNTTGAGIAGKGVIDGLGGEPMVGSSMTWWDLPAQTGSPQFENPRLIDMKPPNTNGFTLHNITLRNSPKFHVMLGSNDFMVWGVTVQAPSRKTNSVGKALTPNYAHNTDGIDPNGSTNGYILYSTISVGDDQIALKCSNAKCSNITIAHNHFGTGHGMSIGSETDAGLDGLHVYDLSIDGLIPNGMGNSSLNGIRIKSDKSCGGLVTNVTYEDVCMRGLANPILLNPNYDTSATGSSYPTFQNVIVRNVRHVDCSGTQAVPSPVVTLKGYDASHPSTVTLDGVMVDGITAGKVVAQYASVTLGPWPVNFTPAASGNVTVTDQRDGTGTYNNCAGKFVAIPAAQ